MIETADANLHWAARDSPLSTQSVLVGEVSRLLDYMEPTMSLIWRSSAISVGVLLGLLSTGGHRADAAPITYNDRSTFESAIQNVLVYDFSNPDLVFNSRTLTSNLIYDGMVAMIDAGEGGEAIDTIATGTLQANQYAVILRFDTPRSAFGFDVTETPGSFMVRAAIPGTSNYFTVTGGGFFGFTMDPGTLVTQLELYPWTRDAGRSPVTIDNLTTTRVPEPASYSLLLIGLAVVSSRWLRRA